MCGSTFRCHLKLINNSGRQFKRNHLFCNMNVFGCKNIATICTTVYVDFVGSDYDDFRNYFIRTGRRKAISF